MLEVSSYLDLLACPQCGAALRLRSGRLFCGADHGFPVVEGVPDLRVADPPYHDRQHELEVVAEVAERARELSYSRLAAWYYTSRQSDGYTERSEVGVRWALGMAQRTEQVMAEVDEFMALAGLPQRRGVGLEIGCGGGGALATLARSHQRVVGINVSLAELMLARRYLRDMGVDNVALIAACAESLPFRSGSFGFSFMEDTIEHVADQRAALAEATRCLQRAGVLHFNSPNRYALLQPEGHVKLRWLGFLPRALMAPYVRLRTGRHYRHIRLLGYLELTDMLSDLAPRASHLVFTPRLRTGAGSLQGRLYRLLDRKLPRLADAAYLLLQAEFRVLVVRLADDAVPTSEEHVSSPDPIPEVGAAAWTAASAVESNESSP